MYLGQVITSTDKRINGKVKKIKNGLTLTIKSVIEKITIEKNKSVRFNNKKACCQLSENIVLNNAIKETGIVIKKGGTLTEKSNMFKSDSIKLSANAENFRESEDM
jgi:hypothetical protein